MSPFITNYDHRQITASMFFPNVIAIFSKMLHIYGIFQ